nr:MAG TPA: hypothetical protein [Caudoviricetes sp.]
MFERTSGMANKAQIAASRHFCSNGIKLHKMIKCRY